jgi:hypothetical protein
VPEGVSLSCIIGHAPSRGFRSFRPRWTLEIARSAHMQGAYNWARAIAKKAEQG